MMCNTNTMYTTEPEWRFIQLSETTDPLSLVRYCRKSVEKETGANSKKCFQKRELSVSKTLFRAFSYITTKMKFSTLGENELFGIFGTDVTHLKNLEEETKYSTLASVCRIWLCLFRVLF